MDWTEIIIALISLVIAPCLILLTKSGIALLQSKTKNEVLNTVLTEIQDAVETAVNATAQTYTDALKAAAADGKLTEDEQAEAMSKAVMTVENSLSASVITYLDNHNININKYIKDRIEAYIGGAK